MQDKVTMRRYINYVSRIMKAIHLKTRWYDSSQVGSKQWSIKPHSTNFIEIYLKSIG